VLLLPVLAVYWNTSGVGAATAGAMKVERRADGGQGHRGSRHLDQDPTAVTPAKALDDERQSDDSPGAHRLRCAAWT
jgi:hypothetical protein